MGTAPIDLAGFAERHGLKQRTIASETGIALSAVCDILNGKRHPRTDTVNKLLSYFRRFDKRVTYEQLFGRAA